MDRGLLMMNVGIGQESKEIARCWIKEIDAKAKNP